MVRLLVRLLAALLAMAVAGAGALLALEVAWQWIRPVDAPLVVPWPAWRDQLAQFTWASTPVLIGAVVVALIGSLVLLTSLVSRPPTVRLRNPVEQVSVSTSPGSLARLIGQHVREQENVTGARVTANRRRVRVRARSRLESDHQLRPRLHESVAELLEQLPLTKRPKLSVAVKSPRKSS